MMGNGSGVAGVGIDIVDIERFRAQLDDPASTFVRCTFTPSERSVAEARPSGDAVRHLAARFAVKEALIKAWAGSRFGRSPVTQQVPWQEIELVHDHQGRPALHLTGLLGREMAGLHPHVSLSHDGGFACAVVILERS